MRKANKKNKIREYRFNVIVKDVVSLGESSRFSVHVSLLVPRLLFDGWSYQDYMSVLDSEDEMEELGRETLEVAKVLYLHLMFTSYILKDVS